MIMEDFDKIENYLDNRLTDKELKEFENELENNAELLEVVNLYKDIRRLLGDSQETAFYNKISGLAERFFHSKKGWQNRLSIF